MANKTKINKKQNHHHQPMMRLLCEKAFSNDVMRSAKIKDYLERVHSDKKSEDLDYFQTVKENSNVVQTLRLFWKHRPVPMLKRLENFIQHISHDSKTSKGSHYQ